MIFFYCWVEAVEVAAEGGFQLERRFMQHGFSITLLVWSKAKTEKLLYSLSQE